MPASATWAASPGRAVGVDELADTDVTEEVLVESPTMKALTSLKPPPGSAPSTSEVTPDAAPSVAVAIKRAAALLPKDSKGQPHRYWGLGASILSVRTLGSDAAFYVRTVSEGVILSFFVLVVKAPEILFNMRGATPGGGDATQEYWDAEYGALAAQGLVTGTNPRIDTWTANGSWPGCGGLGTDAPLFWGRVGGNGELAGAPTLAWIHVICDTLAVLLVVMFLVRLQRLMMQVGTVVAAFPLAHLVQREAGAAQQLRSCCRCDARALARS